MAIYPGAKTLLIPKWNVTHIKRHRRMNLHVAVSNADSLHSMFSRSSSACSHFYVNRRGEVEQYIDTQFMSAADLNGSDSTISVETEGGANPKTVNSEEWTDAQFWALVELWTWARQTHGIVNQLAKNTQTNENSAGLSWHRLGVEGNFKGRGGILEISYKPGGILYSRARGKECPGDAKILQIPEIWKASNEGRKPGKPSKPSNPGKPSKPAGKPSKVPDQSPSNTPNGSTTFPKSYADLEVNGNFKSWEIGALQILLHNVLKSKGKNKQWDGKFEKLTIKDFQQLLQRNGYYLKTPFAAKGAEAGTPLVIDGGAGYWFWVEVQRMLGNDAGNRASGKVYYDLKKYKTDGEPAEETYKGLQRWLNDNN